MAFGGDNAESYYDEGVTAGMKGDVMQAVKYFERAIELDRQHFAAYHQLGKCRLRLGQPQKAVELLQFVIKNKPNQIPPRIDLGFALLDIGLADRARSLFEEISRVKPDNARASLGMAHCAFQQGQWDAAVLLAETAISQGGSNFGAFLLLGRAATFAGRLEISANALERADKLIEKHIETNPGQPEGHYLRGEVQFVEQSFEKAADCYERAADCAQAGRHYSAYDAHFTLIDILAKRGACLQRLGRHEAAREIGRRMLELDPSSATGKMFMQGPAQEAAR